MAKEKKKPEAAFIGCAIKSLPDESMIEAAEIATEENPLNRPPEWAVRAVVNEDAADLPQRIAALTSKYWGNKGVKLGVYFYNSPASALRAKILDYMNRWRTKNPNGTNVTFVESSLGMSQVRLSFENTGYWSYLGTDILANFLAGQPTMNLQGFDRPGVPESEYARVVTHETGHCLRGDTLIDCPRDLAKYPQGVPIKDLAGRTPWVYAWNDGKVVIRKAARVWLSKRKAPVFRVKMRPGKGNFHKTYTPPMELVGTADHPVLLSDGVTWRNLGDLKKGDRLCSMYRGAYEGVRTRIRWSGQPEWTPEQQFVCEHFNGPRPDGYVSHHRNENKIDQSPDNLEWKDNALHAGDHHRGKEISQEHRDAITAALKGRSTSEEARANMKAAQEARTGWKHTDEAREKMRESAKDRPPMPEEQRAAVSEQFKDKPQSPELIEKRTEAMKRFYANGGRSGMFGKKASEETKAKHRAAWERRRAAKAVQVVNHVVVSVEPAGYEDVYDMTVPDAESFVANGVVVHNCLGCPHEHMRAEIINKLDRTKTINYFMQTQGWSQQDVIQQVLTPMAESALLSATPPDPTSVMCYRLPGSITKDGVAIIGGNDINAQDYEYMTKIYPPANVVTPPPNPPVGGNGEKVRISFDYDEKTNGVSNVVVTVPTTQG